MKYLLIITLIGLYFLPPAMTEPEKSNIIIQTGKNSGGCNSGSGSCKMFLDDGFPTSTGDLHGQAFIDIDGRLNIEVNDSDFEHLNQDEFNETNYLRQEGTPELSRSMRVRLFNKDTILNILPGYYPTEHIGNKVTIKF